jgi:hypothetical protein
MIKKIKAGEKVHVEFAEKKHTFEKVNPFFLKVTSADEEKLVSIEKTVEVRVDSLFYENPYFFKWTTPIHASPKTTLKFLLKLPLENKLVIEAGKKDIVVESYHKKGKKVWHGPVNKGILCDFVEPEVYFDPQKGDFANVPLRVINPSNESRLIKRFVIEPDHLMLFEADNGFFTNKVYVNIVGEDQFSVSYGKTTTNAAKKPKKILKAKTRATKKILTSFTPLGLDIGF